MNWFYRILNRRIRQLEAELSDARTLLKDKQITIHELGEQLLAERSSLTRPSQFKRELDAKDQKLREEMPFKKGDLVWREDVIDVLHSEADRSLRYTYEGTSLIPKPEAIERVWKIPAAESHEVIPTAANLAQYANKPLIADFRERIREQLAKRDEKIAALESALRISNDCANDAGHSIRIAEKRIAELEKDLAARDAKMEYIGREYKRACRTLRQAGYKDNFDEFWTPPDSIETPDTIGSRAANLHLTPEELKRFTKGE